jgi:ABC-type multidrug transport system fused ATPase/permease subunit
LIKRLIDFLSEYLRINAIRRTLASVDVRRTEMAALIALAVAIAVFEGVGLSLLLPILQFAEGGQSAILANSGAFWSGLMSVLRAVRLAPTLPVLLLLAFVPILLRQAVFYLNAWCLAVVSGRIAVRMRMKTLDVVLAADPEFFRSNPPGGLTGVVIYQTMMAGQTTLLVLQLLGVSLLMLLYLAILFALSGPLTLTTLVSAVLVSMVVRANIAKTRDFGVKSARVNQEAVEKVVERFSLMQLVKLRDQSESESERIRAYSETMRVIAVKQARLGANIEVTADPLLMLSVFLTLYVGISVLGLGLAQLGLLLFVLTRLNAKVKEFNAVRQAISTNIPGLVIARETAEAAAAANTIRSGHTPFAGLKHELAFIQVEYAFPAAHSMSGEMVSSGQEVLKGISMAVPAGSFTALVGRSGAGKSTLVELIPRLRDATAGTITFDGIDIRDFSVGGLRRGIGYLTQTAMLFNDTVRQNLLYGLESRPTEEQIRDALERAYATFVYDLPDGLETLLGDRGVRFSGGERQRIALARVLLEDTSILILDEPTSALDSESETYIHKALAELHGTKTIIVIAHRLATVIEADQLLVIEGGRITERGTHAELVKRAGSYQRLFESQFLA